MFGGLHLLGEAPEDAAEGFPDWMEPKQPEGEVDMITVAYYSPDAGYPPQRISNYNVPLEAEGTRLEGVGSVSRLPTRRRNFFASVMGPRRRF